MSFVHCLAGHSILREPYALIHATYPAGLKCTCSKSGTTLTAVGTGGKYAFAIPENGTWTIRAYDGATWESSTGKAEQTVTINSRYQVEAVVLGYDYVLFGDKTYYVPFGTGKGLISAASEGKYGTTVTGIYMYGNKSHGLSPSIYTVDPIDVTEYSEACIYGNVTRDEGVVKFCLATTSSYIGDHYVESVDISKTKQIYTIDISSLTGSYYIGAYMLVPNDSTLTYMNIDKIWLKT